MPFTRPTLLSLPNEILQDIASRLPLDKDISNLSLACKDLNARVLGPDSSVWKDRFKAKYDLPDGLTNRQLSDEYRIRETILSKTINFKQQSSERQTLWLVVMQRMILESLTLPLNADEPFKTLKQIRKALTKSRFLEYPRRERPTELFCVVQLCLTSLALTLNRSNRGKLAIKNSCTRFEYDTAVVYSFGDDLTKPFIDHENLDLYRLLHIRSFWQRHMLSRVEQAFYGAFSLLSETARPQLRRTSPDPDWMLNVTWLGFYSCLHPMPTTREDFERQERETCADLRGDHVNFAELMILNIKASQDSFWPAICNRVMPINTGANVVRKYFQGVQAELNEEDEENPVFGFTETIAREYGGIPGWMRICFAICEEGTETSGPAQNNAANTVDNDDMWVHGYEGLVLPGERTMIGRWLDLKMTDGGGRGPFIFWN
ncbi:Uncharacterized protein PECH_008480 [Penicillium ucsense]|uniref:F-box domain-containing protein n=1 Tax=Penicillium ucsense TaxID=2839758 RepID=A0A8J8VZ06_9EURO|nr:Uncharacterized protein PECM_001676 [Penicillium ucsense]KAF7734089.1 Uncharacterized protein PECH_008480 [Penicillium ucsense]